MYSTVPGIWCLYPLALVIGHDKIVIMHFHSRIDKQHTHFRQDFFPWNFIAVTNTEKFV